MCGRRQPDEQQSRVGIAEARHGQPPVRVVTMCALLLAGDAATVLSQPRAAFTRHDRAVNLSESGRHNGTERFHGGSMALQLKIDETSRRDTEERLVIIED